MRDKLTIALQDTHCLARASAAAVKGEWPDSLPDLYTLFADFPGGAGVVRNGERDRILPPVAPEVEHWLLFDRQLADSELLAYAPGAVGDAYGVIYDPTVASAAKACARVRWYNGVLFQFLGAGNSPVSGFRRCVMECASRNVLYYLDAQDSTKKEDGSPADLSGADGDVMVEIPVTYWLCRVLKNGRIFYLTSREPFPGAEVHPFFRVGDGVTVRTQYVGAFQSVLCDAAGVAVAVDENSATPPVYAAGCRARSVAGAKPWSNMSLAVHRAAAAANGAYTQNALFKQYLRLMMLIEGGTMDTQSTYPGFCYASSGSYAHVRNNGRAMFGNGSGSIPADEQRDAGITWQNVAGGRKMIQSCFGGIENPFGQIWEFADGIQKYLRVSGGSVLESGFFHTADCSLYTSGDQSVLASPAYAWSSHAWPASGWEKSWDIRTFFPLTTGGGAASYMTDYLYNDGANGTRCILYGGYIHAGDIGGVYTCGVHCILDYASMLTGSRIAC